MASDGLKMMGVKSAQAAFYRAAEWVNDHFASSLNPDSILKKSAADFSVALDLACFVSRSSGRLTTSTYGP